MNQDMETGNPRARDTSRRSVLAGLAAGAAALATSPRAQAAQWTTNLGYPDPRIKILDPAFAGLRQGLAGVEQLATGFRFTEGPVWFGAHQTLVFSDLPGNRLMRWDDINRTVSVFRSPSNHTNGNCQDREGRLISCEQLTRRVVQIGRAHV